MAKLLIPPSQDGYTAADGWEVASVQLDGGAPRTRRDVLGAVARVAVTWVVGPGEYRYLRAFYRSTYNGALPFTIDLLLDEAILTEYEAKFIPGTFRLAAQRGWSYTVTTELEVKPIVPVNYADEIAIVDVVAAYGSYAAAEPVLEKLDEFVNVTLPDTMGP